MSIESDRSRVMDRFRVRAPTPDPVRWQKRAAAHRDEATMAATSASATEAEHEDVHIEGGELDRFRRILEEKRLAIVQSAQASLEQDMQLDTNEMPDQVDLASSEYI